MRQTRTTETMTSLIDLIFVTNQDSLQSHGTFPPIADHDGIFVTFHCIKSKQSPITKTVYDYKNVDETGLINFVKNLDYNSHIFSKPIKNQAEAMTNI